jgi:CheY-like chemotaxis protein
MNLSSLLVCADEASAQVLRDVLDELSIGVEACPDVARAGIRLAQERYDVVILDCASQGEVTSLLRETRSSRLNDSTLAVAVVQGQEGIREMFSLGVNFVLYKPVSYDRALSSLRAARSVMRKDKRRSARASVHTHATIDYADVEREKGTLIDLAEDGMSVQFGKKIPNLSKVYFQFQLPDQSSSVRLSGQVVWQDWNGRTGVQFVDVPKTSRRLISEFLSANLPKTVQCDALTAVAVELEEAPSQSPVAVGAEAHEHGTQTQEENQGERNSNGQAAARLRSEPDNRRGQMRYACRLGAQVYRTGTPVPNHCCLTDLSAGGCYLEIPLPFPQKSSIEITVRTYDMKLRLRGTVQASHPGYGMGIAFQLKAKEERDQVQKLIDFVASGSPSSS